MQEIKFDAVDYKTHVIGIRKNPRNKTFIFSLVVKVDEREMLQSIKTKSNFLFYLLQSGMHPLMTSYRTCVQLIIWLQIIEYNNPRQ